MILNLSNLLLLLTLAFHLAAHRSAAEIIFEPPFPSIFSEGPRVQILSEFISEVSGYQTIEEYIDIDSGRAANVVTNHYGRQVVYTDGVEDLSYTYKPYSCSVSRVSQLTRPDSLVNMSSTYEIEHNKMVELRTFDVMGIWLLAERRRKRFTNSRMVYSVSRDYNLETLSWTFRDTTDQIEISMHFTETSTDLYTGEPILSLETIQLKSVESSPKDLGVYNIISLKYCIDERSYNELLEPPVGYGCFKSIDDALPGHQEDKGSTESVQYHPISLDLEISATKLGHDPQVKSSSGRRRRRSIDVMNVDIAYSEYFDSRLKNRVYSLRRKNSQQDVKMVYYFKYFVLYQVDQLAGTCSLSHIDDTTSQQLLPNTTLLFRNGLELDMSYEVLNLLLNEGEFVFIRSTDRSGRGGTTTTTTTSGQPEHYYSERTVSNLGDRKGLFRLVRKYVKGGEDDELVLQSVVIWSLSEDSSEINEIYHINIEEITRMDGERGVFDISGPCYLSDNNNNRMKSGRDYAWLEFKYEATDRVLQVLAKNEHELKATMYKNLLKNGLDYIMAPRMEILFDQEEAGFLVRVLILNLPPLEVLFHQKRGSSLVAARGDGDDDGGGGSLVTNHAPDLSHCADMCRLGFCRMMTYCSSAHLCLLTTDSQQPTQEMPQSSCVTYSLPREFLIESSYNLEELYKNSLPSIVAKYQHQDYDIRALPKQPDEIMLPMSETGLSLSQYVDALETYLSKVIAHLDKETTRVPDLTIAATIADHFVILLPSRFEVENDPLDDFDLQIGGQETEASARDQMLRSFHQGLALHRYKLSTDQHGTDSAEVLKQFKWLSYDQCAMACLGARCGSFSYCERQHDCVISSYNNTGLALRVDAVQQDSDCIIYQRDFLGNFLKFESVQLAYNEQHPRRQKEAIDPSECAMDCLAQDTSNSTCLSFDYCKIPGRDGHLCYYYSQRLRSSGALGLAKIDQQSFESSFRPTCDHYARSYLADYNRVEYRRFTNWTLDSHISTTFSGQSVFDCADRCSNELLDCMAFQFCFEPLTQGPKQSCVMLQSPVLVGEATNESPVIASNGTTEERSDFTYDSNCQLFLLRKDTPEAHFRDLSLTNIGSTVAAAAVAAGSLEPQSSNLVWIFLLTSLISASLWCGFCLVKDRNESLRQKIERGRIILGL